MRTTILMLVLIVATATAIVRAANRVAPAVVKAPKLVLDKVVYVYQQYYPANPVSWLFLIRISH